MAFLQNKVRCPPMVGVEKTNRTQRNPCNHTLLGVKERNLAKRDRCALRFCCLSHTGARSALGSYRNHPRNEMLRPLRALFKESYFQFLCVIMDVWQREKLLLKWPPCMHPQMLCLMC